jgi:putative transposase
MTLKSQCARHHSEFIIVTCLNWYCILKDDRIKQIIINSLTYLTKCGRIRVYAFVIMDNHFHMVWQMLGTQERPNVQRDFLKYTAQRILKLMKSEGIPLDPLEVCAKDRRYQVWERNALNIPVWSAWVIWQKINYIHRNPVKAGLCERAEDYHFSSARFYQRGNKHWDFLTHVDG